MCLFIQKPNSINDKLWIVKTEGNFFKKNALWKLQSKLSTVPVVHYALYQTRNNRKILKKLSSSHIRGRIGPNISEQLRLGLSLITSLVIMTWIIVGPGRIFPLVKIWVCLRAYRTSHGGWIKSCSLCLDSLPGIPLVAARAWVKWITVGLDWFRKIFFSPRGWGLY